MSDTCHKIPDMSNVLSKEGIIIVVQGIQSVISFRLWWQEAKVPGFVEFSVKGGEKKITLVLRVFFFFLFKHILGS